MPALHILHGGISNGDRDFLVAAAKRNLSAKRWITPKCAEAGDDAVIYVGTVLFAAARITRRAARRPDWGPRAYGAPLDSIRLLEPPISIRTVKEQIPGLKWAQYPRSVTTPSPSITEQIRNLINSRDRGKLAAAPDEAADLRAILDDRKLTKTFRMALVQARLGQGRFRSDLIERWNGACAVTKCAVLDVLRASHIKPWRTSSNRERLDPANGLLLSANIDALFDAGLITFTYDGRMLVSKLVPASEKKRLGLPRNLVRPLNQKEKRYLTQHRRSKFRS
jgi:hypothetical protein